MPELVFVYGTLKEGFPNFHANKGARVPGVFVTIERFPLYLVGERSVPWMIDDPGQGERIAGELFEVDAAGLARMDALEGTTEPDGYRRRRIAIAPVAGEGAAAIDAWGYLKETRQLAGATLHAGPLAAYTPGHAASYKPRAAPGGAG
ncbi:MAG: gamma-glutamylcyclotransferase [Betaproteobacteria bacterium]|nr:gamma-glutamylcyclotransferase [Betaproteobacteria bacterium]